MIGAYEVETTKLERILTNWITYVRRITFFRLHKLDNKSTTKIQTKCSSALTKFHYTKLAQLINF